MSFLFASNQRRINIGLTLLRLVSGFIFVMHGYQKLFVMGFTGVTGAFAQMGAPLPGFTGPLFAVCELFFGMAVILGLVTRLGALWFIVDMLGAIALVHFARGWSAPGGLEFPVLLLSASVAILLGGPGAYALDNAIAARRSGTSTP